MTFAERFRAPVNAFLFFAGLYWAAASHGQAFINEIHYDNTGTDTGEFVEIAGIAGTDLSAWQVVLYNGSSSQRSTYGTIALSGVIPDAADGFGALSFTYAGIQNGSPDGLALLDGGGNVVEFLSYEGEFVAADGPAIGMTSTAIDVSESSSTPIGESLQRTGTGLNAVDFTWVGPLTESPDMINAGQTFAAPPPATGAVFLNELHYDNAGSDVGEFVEVAGEAGMNLSGWSIVFYNGNGGAPYQTLGLSGIIDDEGDGFGALSFANSGIQNGSPDGLALVDGDGAVVEFLSYEGSFQAVGGAADGMTAEDIGVSEASSTPAGESLQRTGGPGTTADSFVWSGPFPASPGAVNAAQSFSGEPPAPEPEALFIHDIQGSGSSVVVTGLVEVQAVVTALFERRDVVDGFFIQEEEGDMDDSPATSEGIYVYCRGVCPELMAGDIVRVVGTPEEFFGMSQIDAVEGEIERLSGSGSVRASVVTLPAAMATNQEATFEHLEGMLVEFSSPLVVSEYFELARYGQLVLTAEARPRQFTDANLPDVAGYQAYLDGLERSRIILDDDNNDQNDQISHTDDEPYPYPDGGLSLDNRFRGGDRIVGLRGVLHWSWAGFRNTDAWRVRPVEGESYRFEALNPGPAQPEEVGGRLKVASFNVLNYFTTLDEGDNVCGPVGLGCRGAHSEAERVRQLDKIIAALAAMDADVIGLIEIENNASDSLASVANGLSAATGKGYQYVDAGTLGTDAIKVGLLYRTSSVHLVGAHAVLDSSVDPEFVDSKNRPVLAQTFEEAATGAQFTVAVNHLKSKGSDCDDLGDPDAGDGQGNCNGIRTAAAEALQSWLATDPTGSGDTDYLIIGDLNAYAMEDPITALELNGFTNLVRLFGGPEAYSYVFDGQLGYLDHALANDSLLDQVSGVTEWHINADEAGLFDYNDEIEDPDEAFFERKSSALPLYAADPLRSSDHDPLIVGLELDIPGDLNGDGCVNTSDLLVLVLNRVFGPFPGVSADINGDGVLNRQDTRALIRLILKHKGRCVR